MLLMEVWWPSSNSGSRYLIEHAACSFQNVKMKTICLSENLFLWDSQTERQTTNCTQWISNYKIFKGKTFWSSK